jgi:hypothetical protein
MRTKRKGLVDRLRAWRVLAENLRGDLPQFPQLAGDLEDLAAMHAEAEALVRDLSRLRGQAEQTTARLRSLARRGDMLRTRMGAGLRSALGFESMQLIKYGFRPRRSRPGDDALKAPLREGAESAPPAVVELSDELSGEPS